MKTFVEFLGVVVGFIAFCVYVIVAYNIDHSKKWFDLFERRGRDDN